VHASSERLSAVIPTYNSGRYLARCLDALEVAEDVDEVLILDGGSTDGALEPAAGRRGVRVLRRPGTTLARRINLGVREARNEIVLLLDDDAFVDPRTPSRLAEALKQRPRMAAVGAHLRFEDGRAQKSGALHRTLLGVTLVTLGLKRVARWLERGGDLSARQAGLTEVTWLPLCAAALRRSVFQDIGGFDEHFTFYFDDDDFCRRLVEGGWQIGVRWDAGAVHVKGGATAANDPTRWFQQYHVSRQAYLRKHYPRGWRLFAVVWGVRASLNAIVWRLRAVSRRARSDPEGERHARQWARALQRSAFARPV
jgi:N-acetylglucosaminyl-diphospho-decaprenol L-rhamnosyltransferase